MWIIAKTNYNQSSLFISELKKNISNIRIYYPKILHQKKNKNILGNYLFFYYEKFNSSVKSNIKYFKGLDYVLPDFSNHQKEISNFIFDVISKEKKYISVLIDKCVIKISDKCKVLYQNI